MADCADKNYEPVLLKSAAAILDNMHIYYLLSEDNLYVEFNDFSALISETTSSAGLLVLIYLPYEIPSEKEVETWKFVGLLNQNFEFGEFLIFSGVNRLCFKHSVIIPDRVSLDICDEMIREMLEFSFSTAAKMKKYVELFLTTGAAAEELVLSRN